jgi:hypothetical protein
MPRKMEQTMKLISKMAALTLLIAGTQAVPAAAHHSGAMYDSTRTVTIVGTVKAFNWINPHVSVDILADAQGGTPPTLWSIAASSPGVMTRNGWDKSTLKPGDRITMEFQPLRDGGLGGNIKKATLPNGKSLGWGL